MNKSTIALFLGSGILLGLSKFLIIDELIPVYITTLFVVGIPVAILHGILSRREAASAAGAEEAIREAQRLLRERREVRSKIPKNAPRRDSKAASDGLTKLSAARSMAALIRKARLRETVMEICDCADMVLETIRRMPLDTPAAVAFSEAHLAKLTEALEKCFEISRTEDYKRAPASIDLQEIECFAMFITAFRKQQDNILFEGLARKKNRGRTPA
jgi:hypothetical protein